MSASALKVTPNSRSMISGNVNLFVTARRNSGVKEVKTEHVLTSVLQVGHAKRAAVILIFVILYAHVTPKTTSGSMLNINVSANVLLVGLNLNLTVLNNVFTHVTVEITGTQNVKELVLTSAL